jgi:hypothetical protein
MSLDDASLARESLLHLKRRQIDVDMVSVVSLRSSCWMNIVSEVFPSARHIPTLQGRRHLDGTRLEIIDIGSAPVCSGKAARWQYADIVIYRCPAGLDSAAGHSPLLKTGILLAGHGLHLGDVGSVKHDAPTRFFEFADLIFLRRNLPGSPLQSVRRARLYSPTLAVKIACSRMAGS